MWKERCTSLCQHIANLLHLQASWQTSQADTPHAIWHSTVPCAVPVATWPQRSQAFHSSQQRRAAAKQYQAGSVPYLYSIPTTTGTGIQSAAASISQCSCFKEQHSQTREASHPATASHMATSVCATRSWPSGRPLLLHQSSGSGCSLLVAIPPLAMWTFPGLPRHMAALGCGAEAAGAEWQGGDRLTTSQFTILLIPEHSQHRGT